ncbi:DNA ligase [Anatilimnocola floriformis]|uniref:DNA ligase n=1 Tax=Anatilimnocola floriformis TaxID=2948575 RepID=UPI0020C1C6AE|nr:DNA ligase [Anatilimnocola floriformis]
MAELLDGQTAEMQGSGSKPYVLKNTGGVYSCSCPAWRNQSTAIEKRTCKHLRKYLGDEHENNRLAADGVSPVNVRKVETSEGESAAPKILLAETWDNERDLTGWYMSEKLDGVRAYWTGEVFLSRQGNKYLAPSWFTAGLPKTPLDGELWIDRKAFQQTVSIVRRQDQSEHWKKVLYVVFDSPLEPGNFEQRLKAMNQSGLAKANSQLRILEQTICDSTDGLRKELARVEALGGEGLMLRQPDSKYEFGRSSTLLKIKTFHDADAVVTGHQDGEGRHKGRLGALLVELPNGTQFAVGTGFSDAQRAAPPAIGSTITFRYQELTDAGVPRFTSFVRERTDAPTSGKKKSR